MDKWLQQLHFVIKARAYLTGELAMRALSKKQAYYAIIASDISTNHLQSIQERLQFYKIPSIVTLSKSALSELTGSKQVVMLVITNSGLAKTLKEKEPLYEKNSSD